MIGSRLRVLEPLIGQLETVADAGIGDVSQVAAAQRTVAMIRITETDLVGKLDQAKVNFQNIFGTLPKNVTFSSDVFDDSELLAKALAIDVKAPAVVAEHLKYEAAMAQLASIQAKDQFSVGFESRVQRPFGGSSRDSDESLGLVARKTLYDGRKLNPDAMQSRQKLSMRCVS